MLAELCIVNVHDLGSPLQRYKSGVPIPVDDVLRQIMADGRTGDDGKPIVVPVHAPPVADAAPKAPAVIAITVPTKADGLNVNEAAGAAILPPPAQPQTQGNADRLFAELAAAKSALEKAEKDANRFRAQAEKDPRYQTAFANNEAKRVAAQAKLDKLTRECDALCGILPSETATAGEG